MSISELMVAIHKNNVDKGFYEDEKNIGEMLCLVHSEVSEALEADRKDHYFPRIKKAHEDLTIGSLVDFNKDSFFQEVFVNTAKDTFEDELADIMIRVMDLAAYKGIDLESHIEAKMKFNAMRPYKHGKKY